MMLPLSSEEFSENIPVIYQIRYPLTLIQTTQPTLCGLAREHFHSSWVKNVSCSAQENCFSPSPGTCADYSAFQPFAQERKKSLRKKRGRRKVASAKQRLQVAYHFISFPPLGAECWSAFSGSERARAFSVVESSSFREQLFGGVLFYFVVYC